MQYVIDTTLREGEQTPRVSFSDDIKRQIIIGLCAVGVDEIELGVASVENSHLVTLCDFVRSNFPEQSFSLWCRCKEEDIHVAAALSPSVLALSMPVSDRHIYAKLNKSQEWVENRLRDSIQLAIKTGRAMVSVGFEDASRADPLFIRQLAKVAIQSGAFRIRLADTVGIATPDDMVQLLKSLADLDVEIGVHCHNDFGMATANSVTALAHGAEWADATILGLGERAGNSRLEELLSFLTLQKKSANYDLHRLQVLSKYLAASTKRDISPARPIIGSAIFTCETGIHLHGLLTDPATYEPFNPECIGKNRRLLMGRMVGKRAVAACLTQLGISGLDDLTLAKLTKAIRDLATRKNRALHESEIVNLAISV